MPVLSMQERIKHLERMTTPDDWQNMCFLPLKKLGTGTTFPEIGCLYCPITEHTPEPVVYDHNLFSSKFDPTKIKAKYESFVKLIEAGWMVD